MVMNTYIKKNEYLTFKNLTLHPKKLEKVEQTKTKVSRRKEIVKIKAEINQIVNRKKKSRKNQQNYFLINFLNF